jgi:hypothetical protein
LISPSAQEFAKINDRLSREFNSFLVLTLSSFLNPVIKHAQSAACQNSNGVAVEVMDPQTTAIGLGMPIQLAAGSATEGSSLREIDDHMCEFELPSQIALQRGSSPGSLWTDPLRQFVKATFPETLFSERPVQPHLAALLGSNRIGINLMEAL